MKNLSIAILAALSLLSFAGCKKKGGSGSIAKMGEFRDQMCKCADKACADKVTEAMTKWGQEANKEGADKAAKMSEEDTKKAQAVTEEFLKCQQKLMAAAAPPPPAAPTPPAGDTPPAAPPAGDKPADPAAAPPAGDKPADPAAAPPAGDKPK
jgi:hypothetical protein